LLTGGLGKATANSFLNRFFLPTNFEDVRSRHFNLSLSQGEACRSCGSFLKRKLPKDEVEEKENEDSWKQIY